MILLSTITQKKINRRLGKGWVARRSEKGRVEE